MNASSLNILYLPEVALEKIFSFLSFDEIAKNRIICKKFNQVGSKLLSRGFIQLEKRHATIYKKVKSLLPRRESERRAHPLSRHCDILQAIETRISKVLDEMKNVLDHVESDETPPRTHQLLQELRDLSSMAMEHFDEHILPKLKETIDKKTTLGLNSPSLTFRSSPKLMFGPSTFTSQLYKLRRQNKSHKHCIAFLSQSTQKLLQKVKRQNIRLKAQSFKIKEQERKLKEHNTKIQEQETVLAEIKKHIDEWDQRYTDLTNELVRARDDILAATAASQRPSSSSLSPSSTTSSKIFVSNIKPRMAHILPKTYSAFRHVDPDRKRKSNFLPEIPVKRKTPEKDDNKMENQVNTNNIVNLRNCKVKGKVDSDTVVSSSLSPNNVESLHPGNIFKLPVVRKRKMQEDIDLK